MMVIIPGGNIMLLVFPNWFPFDVMYVHSTCSGLVVWDRISKLIGCYFTLQC